MLQCPALETWQIILMLVVLAGSAVVQGAVGFAFALLAVPVLVYLNMPLPQAVMTISVVSFSLSAAASWKLRRHVDWRTLCPTWAAILVGTPLGVWTQSQITLLSPQQVKQVIGGILLTILLVQWAWRVKPRHEVARPWAWLAMFGGGFMSGMVGMGGPPVVLWVMAHDWSSARSRGTMLATFAFYGVITQSNLFLKYGSTVWPAFALGWVFVPTTLLGTWLGLWIGHHIAPPLLRQLTFALLLVIALTAIITPLL